jgi:hypothetical protein
VRLVSISERAPVCSIKFGLYLENVCFSIVVRFVYFHYVKYNRFVGGLCVGGREMYGLLLHYYDDWIQSGFPDIYYTINEVEEGGCVCFKSLSCSCIPVTIPFGLNRISIAIIKLFSRSHLLHQLLRLRTFKNMCDLETGIKEECGTWRPSGHPFCFLFGPRDQFPRLRGLVVFHSPSSQVLE